MDRKIDEQRITGRTDNGDNEKHNYKLHFGHTKSIIQHLKTSMKYKKKKKTYGDDNDTNVWTK